MRLATLLALLALFTSLPVCAQAEEEEEGGNTLIPFPFFFYSPETKSGGGAAISYTRRGDRSQSERPDGYVLTALYTQRNQFLASGGAELYLGERGDRLEASLGFSEFPNTFHGLGNDTDRDRSEDYTPREFAAYVSYQRNLGGPWRTGPSLSAVEQEMREREAGGWLESGAVVGADGGTLVGFGWDLVHDSRDHLYDPRAGGLSVLHLEFSDSGLAGDFDFSTFRLDLRRYRGLSERWTLAARALLAHLEGSPPFQVMPGLGGESLARGYYAGRFRERNLLALQGELRCGYWKRSGLALFVALGEVAHRPSGFRLDGIHLSGGLGYRFRLSQKERIDLRADLGWADGGDGGFYLSMLQAF